MNAVAERYVHLVLAVGQHDPDYVDAFYGPAEWKTQIEKEKKPLDAIGAEAAELSAALAIKELDLSFGILNSPWRLRCARSPICLRAS